MVAFLRRKAANKNRAADAQATVSASDVPPALPPVFHGRTSKASASGPDPEAPSLPGPPKADPAPPLLSDVVPLATTIEDDVDWQALIQFIDAPTLLADKPTREPTPPPPAEKKLPGAALVTSNRYLSPAQKARLTREQSLKQNDPRPRGDQLLLPSLKNSASNATLMSASDSLTDRRHGPAPPHIKDDPQGRVAPDPGLQGAPLGDRATANAKKETPLQDVSSARRDEASLTLGSFLSRKNPKPAPRNADTLVSKVTDGVSSSRLAVRSLVGAAPRSPVVGNGHLDAVNGPKNPPSAKKLIVSGNAKSPPDAKPAVRASQDTSTSERPRVDVLGWQAGVRAAKETEAARRTTRISTSSQHSRSHRPHTAPGRASPHTSSSHLPRSRSPPPDLPHPHTDSHSRSRSPPNRHSTASPTTMMTNEKMTTKFNAAKTSAVPPTSYPERRMSGYSDQRSTTTGHGQNRNRTHSHGQRPLTSDGSAQQGQRHHHHRRSGSDHQAHQGDQGNGHPPMPATASTAYPAGAFSPNAYPNTSFCPTAFAAPAFGPFAYGAPAPGAAHMYNPYNPVFQAFGLGAGAYPTPSPSPVPYGPGGGAAGVNAGKTPGLYKSASATSFFDSVMAGVSNVPGGQNNAAHQHQHQQQQHSARRRNESGVRSANGEHKDSGRPRAVLTKARPTPPPTPPHALLTNAKTSRRTRKTAVYDDTDTDTDSDIHTDDGLRKACSLLDSDPFAKTGGVRVVMTWNDSSGSSSKDSTSGHGHGPAETPARPSYRPTAGQPRPALMADLRGAARVRPDPPTPPSPEDYQAARQQRRGLVLGKEPPPLVAEAIAQRGIRQSVLLDGTSGPEVVALAPADVTGEIEVKVPPKYFPLLAFLSRPVFFSALMAYLEFGDWLALYGVGRRSVRALFDATAAPPSSLRHSFTGIRGFRADVGASNARQLCEIVLERFLRPVGYAKWEYESPEPIVLSLRDLHNYMHGVSLPTHEYARLARAYLELPKDKNVQGPDVLSLALTTRAYTKVVLRLRAQAEAEARVIARLREEHGRSCNTCQQRGRSERGAGGGGGGGGVSSRSSSPSTSSSHHRHPQQQQQQRKKTHTRQGSSSTSTSASSCTCRPLRPKFRSPLFRPNRAALLRVFVPSPDGTWLSTSSVEECEAELRRSGTGVAKLLRAGDVVWDVALGDEGNVGRMVWDGGYLVDLDYKYSRLGELSPYFHSLAFSPSYFHRVIRIGASAGHNPQANPIVYVDVSPWGKEISENLQLLQERGKAETPNGALHDVVQWVHRSSFTIRRPANTPAPSHLQETYPHLIPRSQRAPVPNAPSFLVDPNWYGKVVIEAEGTNEGLVDLQERCGPGVFPPRAETIAKQIRSARENAQARKMWRVVRERSQPGEIFLRAVTEKERVMW